MAAGNVKLCIKRHILPFKPLPVVRAQRDTRLEAGEVAYLFIADDGQAFDFVQAYAFEGEAVERFTQSVLDGGIDVSGYDLHFIGKGGSASLLVDYQLEIVLQVTCEDGVWSVDGGLFTEQTSEMQMQLKMLKSDTASKLLN